MEIVNEAGELTGYEEWREESEAQTEERVLMQEHLLGGKMKTNKESQCMKMVQKPDALNKNREVTHSAKKSSKNKVHKFHQRPKPREMQTTINNRLKWLVNDIDDQSLSVTNPVLQTHERKKNSNEQNADSFIKIPEKLLQRQLNHNHTIEKHNDMRWLSTDNSEHVSYGGKKWLPSNEKKPFEVRHHAEQTQEVQSQTEEFELKKQNESIFKYILTRADQIEERYIEPIGDSQELERVEAWPLDNSFPVTEKVRNDLNTHGQPVEKWGHMMLERETYHDPKKSMKSVGKEGRQRVRKGVLKILTMKKQRDLCSYEKRKSWWPASEDERRKLLLEKLKKHKENEDTSSASVQTLQQWRDARW